MLYRCTAFFRRISLIVLAFTFCGIRFTADPALSAPSDTSPYRLTPASGAAAATALLAVSISEKFIRSPAPDPLQLNRNNVPGPDRIALGLRSGKADDWSDRTLLACTALPLLSAAGAFCSGEGGSFREALTVLAMYAESSSLTHGLTSLAKNTFRRPRPYAYDPSILLETRRGDDAARSLWSGHTAAAFNGAVFAGTVFQAYHPDSPLVIPLWTAGLSAATATAVLRVKAGQHFPSDVIVGAAVGSLTGWLIPRLHRTEPGRTTVSPSVNSAPGILVSRRF